MFSRKTDNELWDLARPQTGTSTEFVSAMLNKNVFLLEIINYDIYFYIKAHWLTVFSC